MLMGLGAAVPSALALGNNSYPTRGWLKFYQKDTTTEIPGKQINVTGQTSYTMPNMSGVNGVDYHPNQGYSGGQDWVPIAWESQNFNVGGKCDASWTLETCKITGGGSFGSSSSGVMKRFKPGAKATPPTASGSGNWWAIYNKSFPVFTQVIRYNANGGKGSMSSTVPNIANLDLNNTDKNGVLVTLAKNKFTRPGYKFVGWEWVYSPGTVFREGGQVYLNFTDSPWNSTSGLFKAKWQKLINITYNGNGSTGGATAAQNNVGVGDTITIRQNGFSRTNYSFAGWNTRADGKGTSYAANSKHAFNASTTLYAQWRINQATIRYDGNGSTGGSTASQTVNVGAETWIHANGFTRTNYTFVKWNTK
ncbi:InlB B-repeat-containing protein, partial [Bifidobacterium sp. SO1]|uniref:InlB B-repeat-containing protein n=1 Tax=Bifidobacterium sp. SO1 TaxID=2809029 RepID=UPI001F0AA4D9